MKFRFAPFLSLLLIALLATACRKTPTDVVLFSAIQDNLQAMEKKDLDAVMATIHPETPTFKATREIIADVFASQADTDVKYTLSDLHVLQATGDEARVSFVQRSEKISGPGEFPNNIVHGIHTLRPDGGKWKMYRTEQTEVTGLDGKPLVPPEAPVADPAPATPAATPVAPEPSAPSDAAVKVTAPTTPVSPAPVEPAPKPDAPAEKPAQ